MDKLIKSKIDFLNEAKENIRKEFIGIDDIIDKIFNQLKIWYLYNETLPAPIVINLFGINGIGKTDLVRSIAKELNLLDKFMKVSMEAAKSSTYDVNMSYNLLYELYCLKIPFDSLGIILLDDIHNFRTINNSGEDIINRSFNDVWDFLSDGTLNSESMDYSLLKDMKNQCEFILNKMITAEKDYSSKLSSKFNQLSKIFLSLDKKDKKYVLSKIPNFTNIINTMNIASISNLDENISYINQMGLEDERLQAIFKHSLYITEPKINSTINSNKNPDSYSSKENLYKNFIMTFKPEKKDLDRIIKIKRNYLYNESLGMMSAFMILNKSINPFSKMMIYMKYMEANKQITSNKNKLGKTTPTELNELIIARNNNDTYDFIHKLSVFDLYIMIENRLSELNNNKIVNKKVMTNFIVFITGNLNNISDKITENVEKKDLIKTSYKKYIDNIYKANLTINDNDVRSSLLKLFRPEQVARLSSNFIICHTLTYDNYNIFVKMNYNKILNNFNNKTTSISIPDTEFFDIKNKNDNTLFNEIMSKRNWDPSQGLRALRAFVIIYANEKIKKVLNEFIKKSELKDSGGVIDE